jgi:hypothetical protein
VAMLGCHVYGGKADAMGIGPDTNLDVELDVEPGALFAETLEGVDAAMLAGLRHGVAALLANVAPVHDRVDERVEAPGTSGQAR